MRTKAKYIFIFFVVLCFIIGRMPIIYSQAAVNTITLEKDNQIIPDANNLVSEGKVLYQAKYTITAKNEKGGAASGKSVTCTVSGSGASVYSCDEKTNASGKAVIKIRKRAHGDITLNIKVGAKTKSFSSTIVKPVLYKRQFEVTVYYTPDEKEYSGSKTTASGVSGKYRSDFLTAVKMEGYGRTDSGSYIGYENGKFSISDKPLSCSGTTLTKEKSVAVDNYYIPRYNDNGTWKRATLSIHGLSYYRRAEDSGGDINGYHIDVYAGIGKTAYNNLCKAIGSSLYTITYQGNNVNVWK